MQCNWYCGVHSFLLEKSGIWLTLRVRHNMLITELTYIPFLRKDRETG